MTELKLNIPNYKKFSRKILRVLVLDNGYFMFRQYALAFQKIGYEVRLFTVRRGDYLAPNYYRKFTDELILFQPDFIFSINFVGFDGDGKLAQLLEILKIPLFCYLIDHPFSVLNNNEINLTLNTECFVLEQNWKTILEKHYHHTAKYLPVALNEQVINRSFSMSEQFEVTYYGHTFLKQIEGYKFANPINKNIDLNRIQESLIDKLLTQIGVDIFKILEELEEKNRRKLNFLSDIKKKQFIMRLLFLSDLFYKEKYLSALISFEEFKIFGDNSWSSILDTRKNIRSSSIKHSELLNLYHNSKISLNLSSVQLPTSFNQKMLEIPICGGFVLSDYRAEHKKIYGLEEFPYFKNSDELLDAVEYYLVHEEERVEITKETSTVILKQHRYLNRVEVLDKYIKDNFRGK